MRKIELDHGPGRMTIDVPDSAYVVVPGESYVEPSPPDSVEALVRKSLSAPLGLPPICDLVDSSSRVVIAFPDRVKGGSHAAAHRRITIPIVLEELLRAGVRKSSIRLICAVGLHRKNTIEEMGAYLPESVIEDPELEIVNHDAEDPEGIVDLGRSDLGDHVQFNRDCAEADLSIVLGHCQGNPYGGFSGGYKSSATGLTTWRSIAGHHAPSTMHRDDFVPISVHSHFRSQLGEIGKAIEERIAGPMLEVDAVLADRSEVLDVVAGRPALVEAATWPTAIRRTNVELPIEPADIVVFGLPRDFHYGPGMGTNPVLLGQAIASTVTRAAGAIRRGGIGIVVAWADGWFNDGWFPSYRETFERYVEVRDVRKMTDVRDEMCTRVEFIDAYRSSFAYHPFHAFSMLAMAEIAHDLLQRIIVVGARRPDQMRALGYGTTDTFDDAVADAKDILGDDARMLVLPSIRNTPVHLFARGG